MYVDHDLRLPASGAQTLAHRDAHDAVRFVGLG